MTLHTNPYAIELKGSISCKEPLRLSTFLSLPPLTYFSVCVAWQKSKMGRSQIDKRCKID